MKRTLLLPFFVASCSAVLFPGLAFADPPNGVLQAVRIETTSGVLTGFFVYSNLAFADLRRVPEPDNFTELPEPQDRGELPPTPDELKKLFFASERMVLYPSIRKISHPRDIIIQVGPSVKVQRDMIRQIGFPSNPLNGYTWYGMLNEVTVEAARLLESPPRYVCTETCGGEVCTTWTWASYDPKVGKEELDLICAEGWSYKRERKSDISSMLKNPRVLRFGESND